MSNLLIINGPNLNRLDLREKDQYGNFTYQELEVFIESVATEFGFTLDLRQSDSEPEIISWLHQASDEKVPIIINPAGLTHTSVALRDACSMLKAPLIEVHLSNPLSREEFRHTSLIAGVANGTIAGFRENSYKLAIIAMRSLVE
jgi:3-dehydroquinate dehydratase-2